MKRANPHERRWRAADEASRGFTRAAAALTERPVTAGAVAFALIEASVALLKLVECDPDMEAHDKVMARLRGARRVA